MKVLAKAEIKNHQGAVGQHHFCSPKRHSDPPASCSTVQVLSFRLTKSLMRRWSPKESRSRAMRKSKSKTRLLTRLFSTMWSAKNCARFRRRFGEKA